MSQNHKINAIVFLEFIDEAKVFVDEYSQYLKKNPNHIKIISFHPLVKSYLSKRNIASNESFHLCKKFQHQQMIEVLRDFSEQVRSKCLLKDSIGAQASYTEDLIFYLRSLVSHLLYRIEVVYQAVKKYAPEKIIAVGSEYVTVGHSLFVTQEERYLVPIVIEIAKLNGIDIRLLKRTEAKETIASLQPVILKSKKILNFILATVATIRIKRGKKLVLAPSVSFQMGNLLKKIRKQTGKTVQYGVINPGLKTAVRIAVKQFLGHEPELFYIPVKPCLGTRKDRHFEQLKRNFNSILYRVIRRWEYRGIRLAKFILNKYQKSLESLVVDETWQNSVSVDKFLKRWQPDLIMAQYSRRMPSVLGELASQSGIQTMIIPHGTFVPSTDLYSRLEWQENAIGIVNTTYSSIALQTPLIEQFVQENDIRKDCYITGPLLFGQKIKKNRHTLKLKAFYAANGEKILLHAGTPKIRSGTRLLNYETIDEYVDGIISLAKATKNINGVHLIIRFREIDGLDKNSLEGLLPKGRHYSIATDGDFKDYLAISDLLISFSSTTIEEALQNDIPVMLYNKYGRYIHIQGVAMDERQADHIKPSAVYNINNETNLKFGLNWILANHLKKENISPSMFEAYKYSLNKRIRLVDLIKGCKINGIVGTKSTFQR